MNKLTRLTALLLAMLMIFSTFATAEPAYQVGGMTVENWQGIVDSAEEKLFTIDEGDSGKEVVPELPEKPEQGEFHPYTDATETVLTVSETGVTRQMTASGVAVLKNSQPGQWQINIGGVWIGIAGETGDALWVTSAMMNGMTTADFRKALEPVDEENGAYTVFSQTATVEIVAEVPASLKMMARADENGSEVTPLPSASDVMTLEAANEELKRSVVTINYLFESNNAVAAQPTYYQVGEHNPQLVRTSINPDITGYKPVALDADDLPAGFTHTVVQDSETEKYVGILSIDATITENVVINIYYEPDEVVYTVKYYQEKISYPANATTDDKYTEITDDQVNQKGLTDSTIAQDILADGNQPQNAETKEQYYAPTNKYPGFLPLLYDDGMKIAADGSTEVPVRYQRLYYLMVFDLDGGVGVDTIYAKYGSEVGTLGTPTRTGYKFKGWTTDPTKTRYIEGEYDGTFATIPTHIPNQNTAFYAVWEPEMVKYTVVYWKENADNSNYSFWGQVENNQALAGDTVSGSDNIPTSITNATVDGNTVNERPYFTYNAAKTNKDVVVAGDGSTVVNVYYYRNTYTVYFRGISGTCAIEEHTHGTNCNSVLDCLQEEHEHNEECPTKLTCTLDEHVHEADCNGLVCQIPEHAEHTAECLICTKTVHENHTDECCSIEVHPEHNADCCSIPEHTHDDSCYTCTEHSHSDSCCEEGGTSWSHWWHSDNCCSLNLTSHTHGDGNCSYTDTEHTHGTGACTCTTPIHTHGGDDCNCDIEIHYHSDDQGCYRDVVHAHTEDCYGFICGEVAHTHTDSCYAYTCGAAEHEHTDDCYRPCTKREHTHGTSCRQNSDDNVIYVVTAKYEQSIANVWPTAANFPNVTFRGWSIDDVSATAVSKRLNMTPDLCDTGDGLKYAEAVTGGSKTYLYYMFESFDQTSPANGNERILRNGKYYDKSEDYYQEVNSSGNWNQKEIYGMAPVSNGVVTSGSNVFLYYTRNRSNLSYYNVNGVVKTVSSIMYEQPLKDYKDGDGNLLSAYVPPYPSGYEAGAYVFKGWYTTPQCYDGTEYNFETETMPNGDLMLYAKWELVTHKVKVYNTKEDAEKAAAGDTSITPLYQWDVSHGLPVTSAYTYENPDHYDPESSDFKKPENGAWEFTYWFYDKNGDSEDDAFSFNSTRIVKDTVVWAGWRANAVVKYKVYYVVQPPESFDKTDAVAYKAYYEDASNWVADFYEGSGLAGNTVTEPAKGGDELYDEDASPAGISYQEGYYPVRESHNVYIDLVEANNVYVFEYVPKGKMPYTVQYLTEVDPGNDLGTVTIDGKLYYRVAEDKVEPDNMKAIVTENYKPVGGNYMPTEFQERLVIEANDTENIIRFFYVKDLTRTTLEINYYTKDYGSDKYELYDDSAEIVSVSPNAYNAVVDVLSIDNYPFVKATRSDGGGTEYEVTANENRQITFTLTEGAQGVVLNLYYDETPVTINYKVATACDGMGTVAVGDGTPGNSVSETLGVVTGEAQGGTASPSTNYKFVGWYSEDGCSEEDFVSTDNPYVPGQLNGLNVAATYYAKFVENEVTINYVAVGPDKQPLTADEKTKIGYVTPESESVKIINGAAKGSTATLLGGPTYKFVGWYSDKDCTNLVSSDAHFTPTKQGDLWVDGTTYYAKFDWNMGSLTITKEGLKAGESAIFKVEAESVTDGKQMYYIILSGNDNMNSATITNLMANSDYTITEQSNWSWSYTPNTDQIQSGKIIAGSTVVKEFSNAKVNKWLYDENGVINDFSKMSGTDVDN